MCIVKQNANIRFITLKIMYEHTHTHTKTILNENCVDEAHTKALSSNMSNIPE